MNVHKSERAEDWAVEPVVPAGLYPAIAIVLPGGVELRVHSSGENRSRLIFDTFEARLLITNLWSAVRQAEMGEKK